MSVTQFVDIFRVLRFPNLLVVAATQALVYHRILLPAFAAEGITPVLTPWKLLELIIVTVLITASGYLINDIQDIKTDAINRPDTNPVERLGAQRVTWFYMGSVLVGFLISQLLAYRLDERSLLFIFPVAVGMLSIYSIGLKRIPALGNLMVALYCAGVPGIILLAERKGVQQLLTTAPEVAGNVLFVCGLFMVFAFFATLLRELVKDLQDLKGDRAVGRQTIPVMWGPKKARFAGLALGMIVIAAMLTPVLLGRSAFLTVNMLACIGLLLFSLVIMLVQILRGESPSDYRKISLELKLFLLGGLGLLLFF